MNLYTVKMSSAAMKTTCTAVVHAVDDMQAKFLVATNQVSRYVSSIEHTLPKTPEAHKLAIEQVTNLYKQDAVFETTLHSDPGIVTFQSN